MRVRGLVFVVMFFAASSAFAGITDLNPLSFGACGDDDVVASQMGSPNGHFSVYQIQGKCTKSCQLAAAACKGEVKSITACQNKVLSLSRAFQFADCQRVFGMLAGEVKTCQQTVSSNIAAEQGTVKVNRAQHSAACDAWGQQCKNTCKEF